MTLDLIMLPPQSELTRGWALRLQSLVTGIRVHVPEDRASALEILPEVVAAFGTLDPELLSVAPRLRWLQAPATAPDAGFFFPKLDEHPVQVTNFRGIYNDHVVNHALALILALARNLPIYFRQQASAQWMRHLEDSSVVALADSTALVIGVGGIGAEIARLLSAFGCRVLGVDPRLEVSPPGMGALHRPDSLDDLLPQANIVVLTLPHTPESEGLIDARRLALFQRGSMLINIGRGQTVRLEAVVKALQSGQLGGVGLDVFEEEPLPMNHALWSEPNALLTPHVAVVGPHTDEKRFQFFCQNAQRFVRGEQLLNIVDKSKWY